MLKFKLTLLNWTIKFCRQTYRTFTVCLLLDAHIYICVYICVTKLLATFISDKWFAWMFLFRNWCLFHTTRIQKQRMHTCVPHICVHSSLLFSLSVFLLLSSSFALSIYMSCCLYIYHMIAIFLIYYDHTVPLHCGKRSTGSSMRWKPGSKFVNLLSPEATSYMTRGFHQITCIMSWKYIQMWYVPNIWP